MKAHERYTRLFYEEIEQRAKGEIVGDHEELIYTGFVTKLVHELDIPLSSYSRLRDNLVKAGCITFLTVGTHSWPSRVQLIRAPVDTDFGDGSGTQHLTPQLKRAKIRELEKEVAALREWRLSITGDASLNIAETLRDLEKRLSKVEQQSRGENATKAKETKNITRTAKISKSV